MNPYARRHLLERRRNSPLRRAQDAFVWLLLGGALGWAFTWAPQRPSPATPALSALPRIPAGSLKGRRIVLASQLPYPPGQGGPNLGAWLKTVLEESGASVESPEAARGVDAPPADLMLFLEPSNSPLTAPLVSSSRGDSAAARAAACLSAELALDLRATLHPPDTSGARAHGQLDVPEVRIMVHPDGNRDPQAGRIAVAVSRALARHFGTPAPAGAAATSPGR